MPGRTEHVIERLEQGRAGHTGLSGVRGEHALENGPSPTLLVMGPSGHCNFNFLAPVELYFDIY